MDRALTHAGEALEHATALERATEMLIANAVLSHGCARQKRSREAARHAQEVERLAAAAWARDVAQQLARPRATSRRLAS